MSLVDQVVSVDHQYLSDSVSWLIRSTQQQDGSFTENSSFRPNKVMVSSPHFVLLLFGGEVFLLRRHSAVSHVCVLTSGCRNEQCPAVSVSDVLRADRLTQGNEHQGPNPAAQSEKPSSSLHLQLFILPILLQQHLQSLLYR